MTNAEYLLFGIIVIVLIIHDIRFSSCGNTYYSVFRSTFNEIADGIFLFISLFPILFERLAQFMIFADSAKKSQVFTSTNFPFNESMVEAASQQVFERLFSIFNSYKNGTTLNEPQDFRRFHRFLNVTTHDA